MELQIKTARRYLCTPIRMVKTRTLTIPNTGKGVLQEEFVGVPNCAATLEDSLAIFHQTKHSSAI
jgi:hypothetical protein